MPTYENKNNLPNLLIKTYNMGLLDECRPYFGYIYIIILLCGFLL